MANSKKRCLHCRDYFSAATMERYPAGWFCGIDHALAYAKARRESAQEKEQKAAERAQRQQTRIRRESLKPRAKWLKEAQEAFNAYIRWRDRYLPCVSCLSTTEVKQNAGHYRSVGSCPALRFNELNVWKQCEHCNSFLSGNQIEYRKELLRRIGPEKLAFIEGPHEAKKYSIDELKAIKTDFKQRIKEQEEGV